MKKRIIGLSVAALLFSGTAYSHDNDFLIAIGLLGVGLALGDGHSSLGIHYSNRGYYNYRGDRYYDRLAYLRAVDRYERERRYYNNRYSNNRYSRYDSYENNYRNYGNTRNNYIYIDRSVTRLDDHRFDRDNNERNRNENSRSNQNRNSNDDRDRDSKRLVMNSNNRSRD